MSIGGHLEIDDNPVLTSVSGASALTSIGSYLEIQRNASLPACEADALAARVGISCSCTGNTGTGTCP